VTEDIEFQHLSGWDLVNTMQAMLELAAECPTPTEELVAAAERVLQGMKQLIADLRRYEASFSTS